MPIVTRAFAVGSRVFHFGRRSGFDFELIKRSTSVHVLKNTKIAVKQETPFLKRVHSSDSSRNTETPHFLLNGNRITLPGDVSIRVYDPIVQILFGAVSLKICSRVKSHTEPKSGLTQTRHFRCFSQVTSARAHLYTEAEGPKGPVFVRSCLSPVVFPKASNPKKRPY